MIGRELLRLALLLSSYELIPDPDHESGALVVHTDTDAQVQLGLYLARKGFRVWTAGTGVDAVWEGLAHAESLDVLICSTDLPDVSAAQVYDRLKVTLPNLRLCALPSDRTPLGSTD